MVYLEMEKWVGGQERPLLAGLHIPNGIYFPKKKNVCLLCSDGSKSLWCLLSYYPRKKERKK